MVSRTRIVVAVAAGGAVVVAATAAVRAHGTDVRGPFERPVGGAAAPVVSTLGSARLVETAEPPMELVPDTTPPRRNAQLLWLGGRVANKIRNGAIVLDAAGGVVEFDLQLRPRPIPIAAEGREWLSVAAGPEGSYWLTDASGALVRAGRDGRVTAETRTRFPYPTVASDSSGAPWVARSSARFTYALDTADAPLVAEQTFGGGAGLDLGTASRPEHILLRDLANAGQVAVTPTAVYFAPFIRDELIAFGPNGDTLWIARRGLAHGTREPRFALAGGHVTIDYSPVNLGLTIGPDNRVYLLSTPDRNTMVSRLDVFDASTGALLRSARLDTSQPTLAGDADGRVYLLDEVSLLSGVPPRERPAAPDIDVPGVDSGRVSLVAHQGHVTLVNLWASWCGPCREEMPALDSLQRAFSMSDSAFAFVSLSDDVKASDARAFLRQYRFTFPVGVGGGALRAQLHAPGMPVTILVDRDGREVHRWIGYAGPEQVGAIRALVRAELDRVRLGDHGMQMHHHGM